MDVDVRKWVQLVINPYQLLESELHQEVLERLNDDNGSCNRQENEDVQHLEFVIVEIENMRGRMI